MENNLLFLTLGTIGLVFVLKYAYIFNIPRRILSRIHFFKELLSCSQCLGFWCGVFVSGCSSILRTGGIDLFYVLVFGFALSFISQLADMLMEALDNHNASSNKKE